MQCVQAVPERLIGVRIEVAVAIEGEAHRGVPGPGGDLFGIRPASIHSADTTMKLVRSFSTTCTRIYLRSLARS